MWRQVPSPLVAVQAQALGLLEQKRRPKVRPLAAIQPTQSLGRAGTYRRRRRRQRQAQVKQIALDRRETRQLHQPRQAIVEQLIVVQRQQAAMEAVLHLQKARIALTVFEGACGHDQFIDTVVVAAAGRLQARAAAGDGEARGGCSHRGFPCRSGKRAW
ncbi:hypothetical protein D3C79_878570 [compost metagenome]